MDKDIWYHVIVRNRGILHNQGAYKSRDAAQNRTDGVQGGEVSIFKTFTSDLNKALQEFRDAEVKAL
jgi:hypothetical protein